MYLKILLFIPLLFMFYSCSSNDSEKELKELETKLNLIAEDYVKFILKIGQHDEDYVDAYYGPEEWKPPAVVSPGDSASIQSLYDEAGILLDSLDALAAYQSDEILTLRYRYLYKQILSAQAKLFLLAGGKFTFDEEAKALYDAEPPHFEEEHFKKIVDSLNYYLPGEGKPVDRLDQFRKDFIIPPDKLDAVFTAAIRESKERTLKFIDLPSNEKFEIEYVSNQPWSGYNWYKGNGFSIIQINTDLDIYIDRAVDLAAHEGYPGHHVYNLLLEKNLFKDRGWVEFSVYPLFSPQSFIAEGTANYGIEMAFPGNERIKFETDILFPIAGLDQSKAELYYKIQSFLAQLSYAGNEAARNFLDGKWNREETINWLAEHSLQSKERAGQKLRFTEKYRSYVINYNYGQDVIKNYISRYAGANEKRRWELFEKLLSTPQTPSGLK
jgi:hypothetical protein